MYDPVLTSLQHSDISPEMTDQRVIDEFLRANGLPTHGNPVVRLARAVAILIKQREP